MVEGAWVACILHEGTVVSGCGCCGEEEEEAKGSLLVALLKTVLCLFGLLWLLLWWLLLLWLLLLLTLFVVGRC